MNHRYEEHYAMNTSVHIQVYPLPYQLPSASHVPEPLSLRTHWEKSFDQILAKIRHDGVRGCDMEYLIS